LVFTGDLSYSGLPRSKPKFIGGVLKTRFTHADNPSRVVLKGIRIAKRPTQTDIAGRLEMPKSYANKYEIDEICLDFVETVLVGKPSYTYKR
jgi:hypothetical protein